MSVDFARAVVAGLEHNGVRVTYPLGDAWLRTGNGQTSAYAGLIWHHTATGSSNTAPSVLWKGRPDLSGPLCNTAGLADGTIAMIAAHPANHAGASGGRSMGPLPTTRTFNKLVWGHEVVYPGDKPMSAAQYRSMLILGGVISGILRRGSAEWCRGHAESSITGKWDPGFAPGKTIDLVAARRDTWAALHSAPPSTSEEDELNDLERRQLSTILMQLTGSADPAKFPGWQAWAGGTGETFTVTDHIRRLNTEVRQAWITAQGLRAAVDKLAEAVARPAGASGPAVSAAEIKAAVADAIREGLVQVEVQVTGTTRAS